MTSPQFLSCEICPKCGVEENNTVTNSRIYTTGRLRRRKCLSCTHRWSTIEVGVKLIAAMREASRTRMETNAGLLLDLYKIDILVQGIRNRVEGGRDVLNLPTFVGEDE